MLDDRDFEAEFGQKTALQRYALPVGAVVLFAGAAALAFVLLRGGAGPAARPHQEPHITQIQLPPPPPPPPPPKIKPPPPKQTEVKVKEQAAPAQKALSKPAPKAPSPPAAVTTSIQGNGPGSLAAGNGGGGDCIGAGCGTGDGSGGDNDAYYSGLIKSQIEEALRQDTELRLAKYRLTLSFLLDQSGHLARISIGSFSGEDDVRAEVVRVVRSISVADAPPASMLTKQFSVQIVERARS